MGKTVNKSTTTKFEGTFPQEFLDHCWYGGSIPQFCRAKRICRTTFDAWCEKYPKMKEAKTIGKLWAEGWWLNQAQENLVTVSSKACAIKFDTSLYKFIMGGRFGHTADKDAHDRLDEIERRLNSSSSDMRKSAYAEIAESEKEDI